MKRFLAGFSAVVFVVVTVLLGSTALAGSPIGYPWSSWGELTHTSGGAEEGLKLDGYAEQGIDWIRLGKSDWILNSFVGLRFTASEHQADWWNNKYGPWLGLKLKHPLLSSPNWGEVSVGVRIEYYDYFTNRPNGPDDELRTVGFFQWSFGGDWKK